MVAKLDGLGDDVAKLCGLADAVANHSRFGDVVAKLGGLGDAVANLLVLVAGALGGTEGREHTESEACNKGGCKLRCYPENYA